MLVKKMTGITCMVLIFAVAVFITACSAAKDEPMPLTQNNIEKFYKQVGAIAKNTDPAAGTEIERIVKVYKPAMDKMGFSLDKTLRYTLLNINQVGGNRTSNQFVQIIWPAYTAAVNNPDEAMKKGLISQKTADLIKMGKDMGESISEESYQFLSTAMDCQKDNNNVCLMPKFIELLAKKGLLSQDLLQGKIDSTNFNSILPLLDKGRFQEWGTKGWVLTPDGAKINYRISPEDSTLKFIVNTPAIEATRKYSLILEDERRSLTKKQ